MHVLKEPKPSAHRRSFCMKLGVWGHEVIVFGMRVVELETVAQPDTGPYSVVRIVMWVLRFLFPRFGINTLCQLPRLGVLKTHTHRTAFSSSIFEVSQQVPILWSTTLPEALLQTGRGWEHEILTVRIRRPKVSSCVEFPCTLTTVAPG